RLRHRPLRQSQDRFDLHGFHHALQSRGWAADRHPGGAPRYLHPRGELPDRAGRALFPGSTRTLVGSAPRRPYCDTPPALSQPRLKFRLPSVNTAARIAASGHHASAEKAKRKVKSKLSALGSDPKKLIGKIL